MLSDKELLSKLTLAVPVYNDAKFIRATLQSCVEEAGQIFIYDNASTDGTSEICAEFARKYPHIIHIKNEENIGAFANFALPLFKCETEYFQWVGSHDRLHKGFTLPLLRKMHADQAAVLAFGKIQYIDEDDIAVKRKNKSRYSELMLSDDPLVRMREMIEGLRDCFIIYGVFRTKVARQIWLDVPCIGFDDAFLFRTACAGKVIYDPEVVFYARDLSKTRKDVDARKRHSEILGHHKQAPVARDMTQMIGQMLETVTSCEQYKNDLARGFQVFQQIYFRYLEPRKERKLRRYKKFSIYALTSVLVVLILSIAIWYFSE